MRQRLTQFLHRVGHSEVWLHGAYYAAVFIEGHGVYTIIAGVLGVVVIIQHFVGE